MFKDLHHPGCFVLGVLETLSLACMEFLALLLAFDLELWWKHCSNKCFENCHPGLPSVVVSGVTEFVLHRCVPFPSLECPCKCRSSCSSDPLFWWCSNAGSLSLVLGAAHCGGGLNHSTYTTLKQNPWHWVFSVFLKTENFFQMLGIISDPNPDVDSFWQHQSHLEEVSKPLWKPLGRLWCILALPPVLPWVLGNFLEQHRADRHCHCSVKQEKQRFGFGGMCPPLVSSLWRSMEPRQLGRRAQLLHGHVSVLVARLWHVPVTAKACGAVWMCLGEEPNAAVGDRAVAESPDNRWLLAVVW